jgi:hypothetical protein
MPHHVHHTIGYIGGKQRTIIQFDIGTIKYEPESRKKNFNLDTMPAYASNYLFRPYYSLTISNTQFNSPVEILH